MTLDEVSESETMSEASNENDGKERKKFSNELSRSGRMRYRSKQIEYCVMNCQRQNVSTGSSNEAMSGKINSIRHHEKMKISEVVPKTIIQNPHMPKQTSNEHHSIIANRTQIKKCKSALMCV